MTAWMSLVGWFATSADQFPFPPSQMSMVRSTFYLPRIFLMTPKEFISYGALSGRKADKFMRKKSDKFMWQKLATIKSEPEYDKEESHTCKKKVEDVMPKNKAATTAKNAGETTDTVVSDNHGQENNMVRIESPDMRLMETSALSADETRYQIPVRK